MAVESPAGVEAPAPSEAEAQQPAPPEGFVRALAADQLVEGEAQRRHDRSVERRIRLARFPVRKTLEQFQWNWPRKINRLQVQNLFRLRFLDEAANVIFIGGVGLGKSHLAVALGLAACHQQHSVLFASAIDAVNSLAAAQATGRLKHELRRFVRPRVLILDELGCAPRGAKKPCGARDPPGAVVAAP